MMHLQEIFLHENKIKIFPLLSVSQPNVKILAQNAFCSWVRAYTAHRGELKKIFVVRKVHLGHVAKSFALKQQPSLVGTLVRKSYQNEFKKRKRHEKQKGMSKKRKMVRRS